MKIEARLRELRARTTTTTPPSDTVPPGPLQARLRAIIAAAPAAAKLGIAVKDLQTSRTLFAWHGDEPLNPASNHKLLTATAAVSLLGAEFRFETRVVRDGDTLFIIGGGDPSLQVADVRALARATVAALGDAASTIKTVAIDETRFSNERFGPGYDPGGPGFSYMAPSAPLSMQFNTVEIRVRATSTGQAPTVALTPHSDHFIVRNTATTGRGGALTIETHHEADDAAGHTIVEVRGKVRSGAKIRRRVTNPGAFAASTFVDEFCRSQTCEGLGLAFATAPKSASAVHTHRSAPLPQVLRSALCYSNNFTTEQVLRTLGHLATGEPGDWRNGSEVLRSFWKATGQDNADLTFENASGLSQAGRVTPMALVDLLDRSLSDDPTTQVINAMPIAGQQGTLAHRLRRSGGRVRAKTGTMRGASALTGVIADSAGQPRVGFSILVNGEVPGGQAHRLQDRVVTALLR